MSNAGMRKVHAVSAGELESDQTSPARQTLCVGKLSPSHPVPGVRGALQLMREASVDRATSFNFTQSDRSITGFTADVPTGVIACSTRQSKTTARSKTADKTSTAVLKSA